MGRFFVEFIFICVCAIRMTSCWGEDFFPSGKISSDPLKGGDQKYEPELLGVARAMDSLTLERTMKTRRDAFPIQISNRVAVDSFRQFNRPKSPATDSRDKCLLILTARQCNLITVFSRRPWTSPWFDSRKPRGLGSGGHNARRARGLFAAASIPRERRGQGTPRSIPLTSSRGEE